MTITKERRDAAKALIREALRFADWAAGEGIAPADGQPATAPDEFLAAYSDATGDDDWDALADRLPALLDALDAAEEAEPVAVKPLEWGRDYVDRVWYGNTPTRWTGPSYLVKDNGIWCINGTGRWVLDNAGDLDVAKAACQADYEDRIRSAITHPAPAVREGWKLVPVEPTEAMLDAAIDEADWRVKVPGADAEAVSVAEQMNNMSKASMASTYRAMLASAPEAK